MAGALCSLSSLPDAVSAFCLSSLLDDAVPSSTSESSALSRKRFTLQGLANLKGQKGKEAVSPAALHAIFVWRPLVPHTATRAHLPPHHSCNQCYIGANA